LFVYSTERDYLLFLVVERQRGKLINKKKHKKRQERNEKK